MSTVFRGEMPDLAKLYAEQIKAVLDKPGTLIETRDGTPGAGGQWAGAVEGANAIRAMLEPNNWREGYEFRVRPEGCHGYVRFKDGAAPLNYANMYDHQPRLSPGDFCLHIELDPEDYTKVRRCEVSRCEAEQE